MKRIYLYTQVLAVAFLSIFATSCDKDLPFPEDITKGVAIDIIRVAGTDPLLSGGITAGNYKVQLSIPTYQGDTSMMNHAQLLAVLTSPTGTSTSQVVVDNITTFPQTIDLNIADVYSKFGKTAPTAGETLCFTPNVVLKSGEVIPGWNQYTGAYNNIAFSGWQVDGRSFSYRVRYPVVCELVLDEFVGDVEISDNFYDDYDAKCVKMSETQLKIEGLLGGTVLININKTDHTVSVPKTVVGNYFQYTNLTISGTGNIDACNGIITFSGPASVDQGSFGTETWVIKVK